MEKLRKQVENCLDKFQKGSLAEQDFQRVLDSIDQGEARSCKQSLLYVYSRSNSVTGSALSLSMVECGKEYPGKSDACNKDRNGLDADGNFIYNSAHEAMADGWRVIKFPEMSLAMDDQNNYGLGYEFILERHCEL